LPSDVNRREGEYNPAPLSCLLFDSTALLGFRQTYQSEACRKSAQTGGFLLGWYAYPTLAHKSRTQGGKGGDKSAEKKKARVQSL
jgi:hypothetical protein